jgi:hypothetical protein
VDISIAPYGQAWMHVEQDEHRVSSTHDTVDSISTFFLAINDVALAAAPLACVALSVASFAD